jgi:hypothetical protein
MSSLYEAIGRVVVWFVRTRYQRQIRVAMGIGLAVVAIGGYLALKSDVKEG